ncbi:MAG: DUF2232 domain-containing protein [Desulfuromonadaceae bacterium]|nr:DUF2232 domain-containing protein [Desulfuromonadaceae bacterium]
MGQRIWPVLGAAVATLFLVLVSDLAPFLTLLGHLLTPFPAAWVHMVAGAWSGVAVIGLSAGMLVFSGGLGEAGGYILHFGIGSFCLPFLLRKKWPWDRAVAVTLLVVTLSAALFFAGYALRGEEKIVARQVAAQLEEAKRISAEAAMPPEQQAELEKILEWMATFVRRAYPALTVASNGLMLLFVLLLLNWAPGVGGRIGGTDFHDWTVSPWLIWGLIGGGFGTLFGGGLVETVSLNLLVVVVPVYYLQGLAIITFFFWKKHTALWLRFVGYLLAALLNPVPLLVTGMGVFDMWIGFRTPKIKKQG